MKKIFTVLSLLICSLVYSQNIFWYDVMLEVNSSINASTVAGLVDDFYSNHPKPSNVNVAFSSIPLKGASEKATHIISISSESSKSLADFRNSLKGKDWDLYISKMDKYVESGRASAGKSLVTNGSKSKYPIGQAWNFKLKNKDLNAAVGAFDKFINSTKFDGFVGMGQVVHGSENAEVAYIYVTYSDLNEAFNFGPKDKKEAAAFAELFTALDLVAEASKTFTRVLIKRY
tara:strand:+ start:39 stop:731 length:693 start_codon:yes stop_codon:yes gene_type:complete